MPKLFHDKKMAWRTKAGGKSSAEASSAPVRRVTARQSVAYLTGGNLAATALYALGGIIIGRLVDPATLGLFNGIGLILTYVAVLQLGVFSGLSRELPYFIGKGDRQRAEDLCATAQAWSLILGGLGFVALLGVAGWQLARGELWLAAGWFTYAILAFQDFYLSYLQVTYRTARDFARFALMRLLTQSALVVLLVLVVPLDFYGLCLRVLLAGAFSLFLYFHWRPVKVAPRWSLADFKHLLRIGLPIFVVGQVLSYWAVIDKTLVLKLGGTRMMGLYSMVVMAVAALEILPGAVAQVFYPRMTEQFGRGESLRTLLRGVARPIAVTVTAVVPAIFILWWMVGPVTRFLIPQYVDAVPAIQWALPLCFVRCFEPALAVFTVVRRQNLRLVGIVTGIAAYAGSLLLLVRDGFQLTAFPQAMIIGRALYVLVCYGLIYYLLRTEGTAHTA